MASTVSNIVHVNLGSAEGVICDFDVTSYATGGETINAATLGLSTELDAFFIIGTEHGTDANHVAYWDDDNEKVVFHVGSTGAEVAATTNLGTHKVFAVAANE